MEIISYFSEPSVEDHLIILIRSELNQGVLNWQIAVEVLEDESES